MSELKCTHSCSDCSRLGCRSASEEQYPPFCLTTNVDKALLEETLEIYRNDPEQGLIARTSACIEGEFYGRLTRVEETIEFIKRMGYKKIGIASCVGLMREASIFARILKAKGIEYFTVGCKVGAQDKTEIGVPNEKKLNGGCGHESMCNPNMQAKTLAAHGCDFNIVIGLCVGHDTLFLRHCTAYSPCIRGLRIWDCKFSKPAAIRHRPNCIPAFLPFGLHHHLPFAVLNDCKNPPAFFLKTGGFFSLTCSIGRSSVFLFAER